MDFSPLIPKLQIFSSFMGIPMEPETFALLVAILLFLISLLVNLLQRRFSKTRLDRMLTKEESIFSFLVDTNKCLANLEWTCTIELQGESSPQEVGKAIHVTRKNIESTIADMGKHLRSFRKYRKKEKAQEKQKKPPGK
jgi:hypothetical protein